MFKVNDIVIYVKLGSWSQFSSWMTLSSCRVLKGVSKLLISKSRFWFESYYLHQQGAPLDFFSDLILGTPKLNKFHFNQS